MAIWYGILMNHQSRHRELLREAARDRLANDLLREQSSPNPPNSRADRRRPSGSGLGAVLAVLSVKRVKSEE